MTDDGQVTDTYKNDKERKEGLRMIENNMPVIPDKKTVKTADGQEWNYRNGVLQYTEEETKELLRVAHEGWLETKRRYGML